MAKEKLTPKTLKRYTKKELLKLSKDYDFGLDDKEKKALNKLKKGDIISRLTGAPFWKCVSKVIPVKTKRERTVKQKEAFEKMKKSLAEQLFDVKYDKTPITGAQGPAAEEAKKQRQKDLDKLGEAIGKNINKVNTTNVGIGTENSSPNMGENTTTPQPTASTGASDAGHTLIPEQGPTVSSNLLNIPSGLDGRITQQRQLEIQNLLNEYNIYKQRQLSEIGGAVQSSIIDITEQKDVEQGISELIEDFTPETKIIDTRNKIGPFGISQNLTFVENVDRLNRQSKEQLLSYALQKNIILEGDIQGLKKENIIKEILRNTNWISSQELKNSLLISGLLNTPRSALMERAIDNDIFVDESESKVSVIEKLLIQIPPDTK